MTAATGMAGLEARRLTAGGVPVRYFAGGSGEPLLLLHGLGGSAANWVELLPALVERFRVLALDLPGHAGSAPLRRGAGMTDFAAVAADVLEAEGVSGRARRRALVRRARRAAARAAAAGARPRAAAGRAGGHRLRDAVRAGGRARDRDASGPAAGSLRCGSGTRSAPGTGARSSGRGSSSDADALSAGATHGLLAGIREHTGREGRRARDGRRRSAGRISTPSAAPSSCSGGARRAAAARRRVRVRPPAAREAPDRRRLRPSRSRRAAGGVDRRARGARACEERGVTSVTLRPLREDEFDDWNEAHTRRYADGMVEFAGLAREAAERKAAADVALRAARRARDRGPPVLGDRGREGGSSARSSSASGRARRGSTTSSSTRRSAGAASDGRRCSRSRKRSGSSASRASG